MVKSVRILDGFAAEAPHIKNRIFEFNDNFNVLFGPNGCYKSTLLKYIKAYCGIMKGGWSRLGEPQHTAANKVAHFPYAYEAYTPEHTHAHVVTDGMPAFFNDGDVKVNDFSWFFAKEVLSEDGITNEEEQMRFMTDKPSSGMYRAAKLNKVMQMLHQIPNLADGTGPEAEYYKTLPRNGKPVLLLDEPERAFSLPRQKALFEHLESITDKFQIIIATHSPFILFQKNVNIIDVTSGYAEECLDILKKAVEEKNATA